jgi:ribosomal protein S18 acetylase RimI-like enzyme
VVEDAAVIARVQTLAWREAYAGLLPDAFLARETPTELWRQRLRGLEPPTVCFVAERGPSVVGFALAGAPPEGEREDDRTVGQLYAIYVLAEVWGSGVGYRLHQATVAALVDAGFAAAVLWVLDGNQRAIDFYRRQGWMDDNEKRQEEIDGQILNVQRYRRLLR